MKKLGIVCGGGPAPGINSVIRAVVIEARNRNLEVIGFLDGFSHLSKKEIVYKNLEIEDVSRIHHYGGSIIGTSRGNSSDEEVFNTYLSLINSGINYLVSIGGDGTASMIYKISKLDKDKKIKFAHIPKTIDNDFPLPPSSRTFGFETARNLGMELVLNLIEDAKILKRWFFVQVMGRSSGHLAIGIGKSSGATLTIIPEEFQNYEKIPLKLLLDILEGSIIKRLAYNKPYGVAILAEGLSLKLENLNLQNYHSISEFPLAELLANEIENRLKKRNINIRIIPQNIGYVLRNAHPIAFDISYTITLGYGAVKFLLSDNNIHCAVITLRGEKIEPIDINEFIKDDKVKIRYVDLKGEVYESAYHYMIRLKKEDFENEEFLLKLCDVSKMEKEEFIKNFKWTTEFPPI
ncbi:MAG: 6-phosphofructokinase [Candidatus Hydrothermia bacterium]|jgi:6-phosphofructokinase 1|nr:6-phosphofructokinase [Candidatus Hydrothermia bacterium]